MNVETEIGTVEVTIKTPTHVRLLCRNARINGKDHTVDWEVVRIDDRYWQSKPSVGFIRVQRHDKANATHNAISKAKEVCERILDTLTPEQLEEGKVNELLTKRDETQTLVNELTTALKEAQKLLDDYNRQLSIMNGGKE